MKTKIKIHFEDGSREINCDYVILKEPIVEINKFQNYEALLLEAKNFNMYSRLNIENIEACNLLTFDEEMNFITVVSNLCRESNRFSLLIPEAYILILTNRIEIKTESLKGFDFIINIHNQFENQINFLSQREMIIKERSLVLNVESIEKHYPGGFSAFFSSNDFYGETNGYIVVLSNHENIPKYFHRIIDSVFAPNNFKENVDYYTMFGEDNYDNRISSNALWKVTNAWLNIMFDLRGDSYVWHSNFDKDQQNFMENIKKEYPWTQYWAFWYSVHPILKNIKLKTILGFHAFTLDDKWIDKVELEEFVKKDDTKLPFVIGTQLGIRPNIESTFPSNYSGYIMVLSKSQFSGTVAWSSIYYIENGKLDAGNKLLKIDNDLGMNPRLNRRFQKMFFSNN